MITNQLNLSMSNPKIVQAFAKQGDKGRIYKINLDDATEENGTMRIKRVDGEEYTSPAQKQVGGDAYKGDLVTFSALEEVPLTKCEVTLESSQDLHGQSSPYPAGGGKNKIDDTIKTVNGNSLLIGATTTAEYPFHLKVGTYRLTVFRTTSASQIYGYLKTSTSDNIIAINNQSGSTPSGTVNITTEGDYRIWIYGGSGSTVDGSITHVSLTEGSDAVTEYIPYSNICPIYPSNGKNLYSGTQSISLGGENARTLDVNIATIPQGSYYVSSVNSGTATTTHWGMQFFNSSNQNVGNIGGGNGTLTLSGDAVKIYFYIGSTYYEQGKTVELSNIQFEQGSTATPYVPYQGINVEQSGENFIANATIVQGGFNVSNGNDYPSTTRLRTNTYHAVSQGTYKICCDESYEWVCYVYSTSNAFIDAESQKSWQTTDTLMTIVGDRHVRVGWRKKDNVSTIVPSEIHHPYMAKSADYSTHSISLGRSVYGGKVDLATGKLVVDRAYMTVGTSGWTYYSPYIFITKDDKVTPSVGDTTYPLMCSMLPYGGCNYASQFPDMSVCQAANKNIYIKDSSCASANEFYAKYKDAEIVYYLATPIEYDLTPTQISTLLGENNVWSSGEVEVAFEYDGLLAELPQDATEIVGNQLGDVDFNGASTMPFILTIKKNHEVTT